MNWNIDLLVHAANGLYLLAFTVRDVLWLRVFTVVASGFLLPYFYLQPAPLMTPIYWNLAFTTLNLFWIMKLVMERRPVVLSDNERHLCELVFHTMTPREMIKILRLAEWENAAAGECFVSQGTRLDRLMVIFSGSASVELDGRRLAKLFPGRFVGSISYLTEETAPANIVALEPTQYVCWHKRKLKSYMKANPDLHAALQTTLAVDLTRWLGASWKKAT